MIVHVILFRPKVDLSAADRRHLIDAFVNAIHQIPTLRRARVGRRLAHGAQYEQLMTTNYSHAALLEFDNADSLGAYLQHPAHAELGRRFLEACESTLIYDFDFPENLDAIAEEFD